MIKKKCFKIKYIREKSQEIKTDPILIERAIYAFELLALLVKSNLPLVFKGGTSLMLLVPRFNRLSIDLDIVTEAEDRTMKNTFTSITEGGLFKRWEEDTRSSDLEVPKSHFKFYYDSPITGKELYVLVDIIQSKPDFPSIVKKPILHPIFEVEEETEVSVPSINCIAGDKLTAFAPKTIGILFGKEKSMEIIKQLFDLGILFELISDLKEVHDSYLNISKLESQYRNLDVPIEAFFDDSIKTSLLLCQSGFKGCVENDETKELKNGIMRIKSHILGGKYSLLQAKVDASKVACLSSLMRDGRLDVDIEEIRRNRKNLDKIANVNLISTFSILIKLKKISPESFYLWAVALKMI